MECNAIRQRNVSTSKKDESQKQYLILVSYLYRARLFVFFLSQKRFCSAFWPFVWTIGPFHFLFERLFLGSFNFPSFYKLGNLLSLNFAKRKLLRVLCFHFSVAKFIVLRAFGIIGASLTPTGKRKIIYVNNCQRKIILISALVFIHITITNFFQ